jgi:hypothetical protein
MADIPQDIPQGPGIGFESPGSDWGADYMSEPFPVGPEMPGIPIGITVSDIMQGMAISDPVPQGPGIGIESDSGSFNDADQANSTGFRLTGGTPPASGNPPDVSAAANPTPAGNQQGGDSPNDGSAWADF